ncbi:hypothetical protein [Oceaniglobus trochenteri]|uniref:hypothetical protein n=1 Tax=Oceaniglobus trochenteri TaxID=2763260 RepID=UPI001CFF916C|nr:hypothetical protein [Oceaniglobus trochenteri]
MTLTVPQSNARPGRAPQVRVEANGAGEAIEQFGQVMNKVGTRIVEDRLSRATARAETDFTRDIGQLRLEFDQMTDPDEIDAQWGPRVAELKARYIEGQDPRVRDRLDIGFDRLANTHANALGARAIALGQQQREADWITYRHETLNQAARSDPETRDELLSTGLAKIDSLVTDGTITADEGALRKVRLIGDADNASATSLIAEDPAAFLTAAEAGIYDGLGAETLATKKVQAQARLDAEAAELERASEKADRERKAGIGDWLSDATAILKSGRQLKDVARLNDPEVQAHPAYAEASAAYDLALEIPNLALLTPQELRQALQRERNDPVEKPFQLEREKVLRDALAEAEAGWKRDAVAYAGTKDNVLSFPELPDFDPADPEAYARGIAARVRHAGYLQENGYIDDLAVLDAEQRAALKQQTGPEADPHARTVLAAALHGGLTEAPELFETVSDDPVFRHVGRMLSSGLNPVTAEELFKGQQALAQGNVSLPPARSRQDAAFSEIGDIYADVRGGQALQAETIAAADALYAARMGRIDPGADIDEDVYRQALHEANGGLGPYDSPRKAKGGVQTINGQPTLLPPDMTAAEVQDAYDRIEDQLDGWRDNQGYGLRKFAAKDNEIILRGLRAASINGKDPVLGPPERAAGLFRDVRFIKLPGADDLYYLRYERSGEPYFVEDTEGATFVFSLRDLIEGSRE